jgi:hypothetical protein
LVERWAPENAKAEPAAAKKKSWFGKKEVDKQKRFKYKGGPLRDQREAKAGLKKEEKRS